MTRVLPEPAPARISSGPWMCRTASRCSALRACRKSINPWLGLFWAETLARLTGKATEARATDGSAGHDQLYSTVTLLARLRG